MIIYAYIYLTHFSLFLSCIKLDIFIYAQTVLPFQVFILRNKCYIKYLKSAITCLLYTNTHPS